MDDKQEQYIDHEVRLRVKEGIIKDIKDTLGRLDDKMDNQFKWIIGIIVTMFLTFLFTK